MGCYNKHMKRTNLVLNADLLDEAIRVLGVKTYSAAVNLALEETLRVKKLQNLPQFFGRGLWEGDLSEMREDRSRSAPQKLNRNKGRK
jgi:Arc/MetJ family transcription regulator